MSRRGFTDAVFGPVAAAARLVAALLFVAVAVVLVVEIIIALSGE